MLGFVSSSVFQENIEKGVELNKIDNRNTIKENIQLIREILKLRKDIKSLKSTEKAEIIIQRKDKRIKNILPRDYQNMDLQQLKEELLNQEKILREKLFLYGSQ